MIIAITHAHHFSDFILILTAPQGCDQVVHGFLFIHDLHMLAILFVMFPDFITH